MGTFMFQQGTFFTYGTYLLWQASRLASWRLVKLVKHHYLLLFFLLSIPLMLARINVNPRAVIWSDAEGYYQYLPAVFVIKDVHKLPPGSVWPYYNKQGEYVNKYTCGIAYFELPFFFAAYMLSKPLGYDPSEYFNPVYCRAMALCGLFFAFLGLFYMRKSLLRIVSPFITFLVICSVFLGTNLFHYATKEMSISHVFSFLLFSLLIYMLPEYLKKQSTRNSLIIGALLGWIILIRPTNIIIAFLLLLYSVYTWNDLKDRVILLVRNIKSLLLMAIGSIFPFIPQLLYWKEMTGDWIYYSYTNEGFPYWNQPKIAAVLFDVQNGLFLYSPLVLLMIVGIFTNLNKKKFQAPVALLFFTVATYIFASWWAWWFGGAFGHRCYVEFYAILAFPLAGLYQQVFRSWRPIFKYSFFTLVVLLMAFSVRFSYLYSSAGGPWDGPEWRWNWEKYGEILRHLI